MSGAFNIDIEVGALDGSRDKIKIYCASLTDTWEVVHSGKELAAFHAKLSKDAAMIKNKISPGALPKITDVAACEMFLSRLGCTSAVLRIPLFHDFLSIPKPVRDGLVYASHKPFGKNLREGYMQRHPRFVRRGGGKRWIRLTKDDRGGSLICYRDENKNSGVMSSIKIGNSTEVRNLRGKGIPNAFVLKSGKRQWVLQAGSTKDYQSWQGKLNNMLKQFGSRVTGGAEEKAAGDIVIGIGPSGNNEQFSKQQQKNVELKAELDRLHGQMEGMQRELDRLKMTHADGQSGNEAMKKKVELEFQKETDALVRDYELQSQNLTDELGELHRQIDAKTAMDSGNSGGSGFKFSLGLKSKEVLKSEVDTEKKILDTFTDDERAMIKFMHKHLHRHKHVHSHQHKHIHLHKDAADNIDNVDIKDMELADKHTISHTITHSNTQFQIEKDAGFF